MHLRRGASACDDGTAACSRRNGLKDGGVVLEVDDRESSSCNSQSSEIQVDHGSDEEWNEDIIANLSLFYSEILRDIDVKHKARA
jgi:hypothetical protein